MKVHFIKLNHELLQNHSRLNSIFRTIQRIRMYDNFCKPESISISSRDGVLTPSTIMLRPLTVFIHNFFSPFSINKLIYDVLTKKQTDNVLLSNDIEVGITFRTEDNIVAKYIVQLLKDNKYEKVEVIRYENNKENRIIFSFESKGSTRSLDLLRHYGNKSKTYFMLENCVNGIAYYNFINLTYNKLSFSNEFCFRLESDGSNVFPYLYEIKKTDPNSYERILYAMQLIYPVLKDLIFDEKGDILEVKYRHVSDSSRLDIRMWSHNLFTCLALFTLLMSPADWLPRIMLIDNVEAGLHPYALYLVVEALEAISANKTVIISTSSPMIIERIQLDSIFAMQYRDNKVNIKHLNDKSIQHILQEHDVLSLFLSGATDVLI